MGIGKEKFSRWEQLFFWTLLFVGCSVRLLFLGRFPAGIHQDEAYAGYEALCLLKNGMDSWGYPFPVYLTAWGSGMNALESYLAIPFVALLGNSLLAIRLPQALVACLSLPAFYVLLSRLFGKRTGLWGMFLLAICPWHLVMSRWGLESNLAPGFLLFALMFLVLSADDPRYYIPTGLFYGLSLYAYATIWPIVPLMLALFLLYMLHTHKLRFGWPLLVGVLLLALLAIPLLLFLLVNRDILPEIVTPFFSVPRLPSFRSYDISLGSVYENLYAMFFMLLRQRDDAPWCSAGPFGLYYFISVPFILLGLVLCLVRTARALRRREWDGAPLILVCLLGSLAQGIVIHGSVVHLNSIHLPIVCLWTLGLVKALELLKKRRFRAAVLGAYLASFTLLLGFYFGPYGNTGIAAYFTQGLDQAVSAAQEAAGDGEIHLPDRIHHSKILFLTGMPLDEMRENSVWPAPGAYMQAERIGQFVFQLDRDTPLREQGVCILETANLPYYDTEGCEIRSFGVMSAVLPDSPAKK